MPRAKEVRLFHAAFLHAAFLPGLPPADDATTALPGTDDATAATPQHSNETTGSPAADAGTGLAPGQVVGTPMSVVGAERPADEVADDTTRLPDTPSAQQEPPIAKADPTRPS